jgi:poly(A) polymerase
VTGAAHVVDGKLTGAAFLENPRVQRVFATLDSKGEDTRVVGGAIRNALMGLAVHEVDFATTLEPDAIMERAREAGVRAIPTGIEHGTVTLLIEGETFEVTTLRHDVETDGRYAKVRFGRSFEEDALRRDFTFNALSITRDGSLFDYTDGVADIGRRHVRFIGEARQRIREDYLRILRFFRFHAAYGEGAMNREAFEAAISEHAGIERLSRERVRAELLKLLAARRCADVIGDVAGAGILGPILAGVAHPTRLANLVTIESGAGDAVLRLAALALLVEEDADRLLDHLRLSNAERDRLAAAARVMAKLRGLEALEPKALRVLDYRHGRPALLDALRLAWASEGRDRSEALAFVASEPLRKMPVRGAELIKRGVAPGPALGVALAEIERRWVEADFPTDEATVNGLVENILSPRP